MLFFCDFIQVYAFTTNHHLNTTSPTRGGAMELIKLQVPWRLTNLDKGKARAYCACSRYGSGLFGHFSLVYLFSFFSLSLGDGPIYRLKYCLKGPLSPKQPTNRLSVIPLPFFQ